MIEALLEMQFAPQKDAEKFRCKSCPQSIQELRRCRENRWDFNGDDGHIWPMRIQPGGGLYGFCPGKATWDSRAVLLFKAFVVCAETGAQWQPGGISDQPAWWVDLVSDALPRYNDLRFYARAKSILGDGKGAGHHGNIQGNSGIPDKSNYRQRKS
jgi:hypothetical protein